MDISKKDLFYASLLPPLGLLFGHIFMWSNNAHMFTNEALFGSFILIAGIALIIFCGTYFILPKILSLLPQKVSKIVFCVLIAVLFVFLAWVIINYTHIPYKNKIYAPILVLIVFFIVYLNRTRVLIVFLYAMITISSVVFIKNAVFDSKQKISMMIS